MSRVLFGTDGIRGKANRYPVTAEVALRLGMAAGSIYRHSEFRPRVVIAKDTRLSGYLLEPALTSGFVGVGMDVILVGPMPTPAVAMLVRSLRADLGVMISASHNSYDDNGIKLFDRDGYKLSDEAEALIEARMDSDLNQYLADSSNLGRAKRLDDVRGRYMEYVKQTFPRGMRLDGLKIVLDCANGAAYHVGPDVLWELGADVIAINVDPDGFNINKNCGSTHTEALRKAVLEHGADLGIALDGDADRLAMCDEKGNVTDGDQIMAMVAEVMHMRGQLKGGGIVATHMSNIGLERFLKTMDLNLHRTNVGDRYVMEAMRDHGYNVGGEQSGHIILSDYSTSGDGLLAALQVLALLVEKNCTFSDASKMFEPLPQLLENVRFSGASPLESPLVKDAIEQAEQKLSGKGRLFIRKSGTEPLIRVMAEAETMDQVKAAVGAVVDAIKAA